MPSTSTPVNQISARGERIIEKRHRGVRIAFRLGSISQELAEQRLRDHGFSLALTFGVGADPKLRLKIRSASTNSESSLESVEKCGARNWVRCES